MRKLVYLCLLLFATSNMIAQEHINNDGFLPFLNNLKTSSTRIDFKKHFPKAIFQNNNSKNFDYDFGDVSYEIFNLKCTGSFNTDNELTSLMFSYKNHKNSRTLYEKVKDLFDEKLKEYAKENTELDPYFFEEQIHYKKANKKYGITKYKKGVTETAVSILVTIEPLNEYNYKLNKENKHRNILDSLTVLYRKENALYIINGLIKIGMTKEMVLASLGKPTRTNTSYSSQNRFEQLVYRSYKNKNVLYVYLENDIVTSYQESK